MNNVRTMFFLYNVRLNKMRLYRQCSDNVKLNKMRLYRQCSDNVKLNKKTLFKMTLFKK